MTKTLTELQKLCTQHGIDIPPQRRAAKEPFLLALRDHFWAKENPDQPLPVQTEPMLLGDWSDLEDSDAIAIEQDDSGWCVQEKLDGIRVLLHVTADGVRITGRNVSDVTFRLTEFAANLPHLASGFENLVGTVIDGELFSTKAVIDTGDTITTHPLQAAVAILTTTPENATAIQVQQDCWLRLMAFDVLRFRDEDTTTEPLSERLKMLDTVYLMAENQFLGLIETQTENKGFFHELLLADGKEGTVWKKLDERYEAGKRVRHWIKRKKGIQVEATISGFKLGTAGKGNADLIGALEFSTVDEAGQTKPIAWICSLTTSDRKAMTHTSESGIAELNPSYLGRRAILAGHDISRKSGRMRHARLVHWIGVKSPDEACFA